jgi:hypothetical protein
MEGCRDGGMGGMGGIGGMEGWRDGGMERDLNLQFKLMDGSISGYEVVLLLHLGGRRRNEGQTFFRVFDVLFLENVSVSERKKYSEKISKIGFARPRVFFFQTSSGVFQNIF